MGIFNFLKSAAVETNEEMHGVRLEQGLNDIMPRITQMHDSVRPDTLIGFLRGRDDLRVRMRNWSREGCLKVARELQEEARNKYDLNIAKSYALWLTGAWLEGAVRNSSRARAVHEQLEDFARHMLTDPNIANVVKNRP